MWKGPKSRMAKWSADMTETSYTMGYSDEFRQMLNRRSAEIPCCRTSCRCSSPECACSTLAADPGPSRLDWPEPWIRGKSTASTSRRSQINLARAAAEAGGHRNATFHVGDVTDLPFDDQFVRRRPLPRRAHARSGHDRKRSSEVKRVSEAGRHHRQP